MTKRLGKETARNNIAVNAITPAAARTKIFDQMLQEHIDYMLSLVPRGRFVQVEEIAAMVAWRVSEEHSLAPRRGARPVRRARDLLIRHGGAPRGS